METIVWRAKGGLKKFPKLWISCGLLGGCFKLDARHPHSAARPKRSERRFAAQKFDFPWPLVAHYEKRPQDGAGLRLSYGVVVEAAGIDFRPVLDDLG